LRTTIKRRSSRRSSKECLSNDSTVDPIPVILAGQSLKSTYSSTRYSAFGFFHESTPYGRLNEKHFQILGEFLEILEFKSFPPRYQTKNIFQRGGSLSIDPIWLG
jgi:hypothetical protein